MVESTGTLELFSTMCSAKLIYLYQEANATCTEHIEHYDIVSLKNRFLFLRAIHVHVHINWKVCLFN